MDTLLYILTLLYRYNFVDTLLYRQYYRHAHYYKHIYTQTIIDTHYYIQLYMHPILYIHTFLYIHIVCVCACVCIYIYMGFTGGSDGKESACSAGDPGSIPEWERSPGGGNGNPLQYSCLKNPMAGGARWATVHGVVQSRT